MAYPNKLYNLARMTTATTGTGTITLGSAVSGFLTFAQAGVQDGDVVSYGIRDGSNSEAGIGTYASSGTTLTRAPVVSTNSNAAINLSGSAEVYVTALAGDIIAPSPQCGRMTYVSTTQVKFAPYNGSLIKINGHIYSIPSSGITLSNSGLSATTLYYVYCYDNSGTLTLEASTTAHATSTTAGNVGTEIKSGDDTRSFVGWIRTDGSSLFANSATQMFVISFFNRRSVGGVNTTSTTSTGQIGRIEFIATGDDDPFVSFGWTNTNNNAYAINSAQHYVDGSGLYSSFSQDSGAVTGERVTIANATSCALTEGYHYYEVNVATNGSISTANTLTSVLLRG